MAQAIERFSAIVIASETKQSSHKSLGCFVADAPRNDGWEISCNGLNKKRSNV
jgi:hypothetical protein